MQTLKPSTCSREAWVTRCWPVILLLDLVGERAQSVCTCSTVCLSERARSLCRSLCLTLFLFRAKFTTFNPTFVSNKIVVFSHQSPVSSCPPSSHFSPVSRSLSLFDVLTRLLQHTHVSLQYRGDKRRSLDELLSGER